tara:strand:- start:71211 stop:73139 length:1929 start_codon:yes stop_codon:yes gene_type:complete
MSEISSWQVVDGIALLTLNNPPVNAISAAVRRAIIDGIARTNNDANVDALVIACAGRTFFPGADLKEFGKPPIEPFLTEVVDVIEASNKAVVAAIHGTALGGGLEIAMACHWRVAVTSAKLGLPEVKLALMPGARGTQYLPRLVGVERALEIIALGDPISAHTAADIGLIDELATDGLIPTAINFARHIAGRQPRRTRDMEAAPVEDEIYDRFIAKHARKFKGYDAPTAIVDSIRAATQLQFDEGAKKEREIFLKLREGPQNAAMRHVFFAERQAAKLPELEGIEPRNIASTGVIGAGTMGSGIAIALLSAGLPVTLYERNSKALNCGVTKIKSAIEGNLRSGRTSRDKANKALASLSTTVDIDRLAQADLVIEAAFETMDVKRAIFTELDHVMKPNAILATNTSYLDIDAIAEVTRRPQDIVGLHFFSPAHIMKLLEIVRGKHTALDVLATSLTLAKRIQKLPVISGNAYGFIGNRMLAVRRKEAETMLVEGACVQHVDRVLEEFGFPMGPFKIGDLAGLDLGWSAETSTGSTIRERLCEAGRLGQKAGAGFYDYDSAGKPQPSIIAEEIVTNFADDNGQKRRDFDDDEILDRLLWPMVNEGAQLLGEGIALRASDIDTVWLNGYGWPKWTGGPMFRQLYT